MPKTTLDFDTVLSTGGNGGVMEFKELRRFHFSQISSLLKKISNTAERGYLYDNQRQKFSLKLIVLLGISSKKA